MMSVLIPMVPRFNQRGTWVRFYAQTAGGLLNEVRAIGWVSADLIEEPLRANSSQYIMVARSRI